MHHHHYHQNAVGLTNALPAFNIKTNSSFRISFDSIRSEIPLMKIEFTTVKSSISNTKNICVVQLNTKKKHLYVMNTFRNYVHDINIITEINL